nr:PLP-dependent aminotransferase family protein [Aminipila luticellarii]
MTGALAEGNFLPSTRGLAQSLKVSRNTVASAYSQLCAEGYITGKNGSGYVVLPFDVSLFKAISGEKTGETLEPGKRKSTEKDIKFDFQYDKLNMGDFPMGAWKKSLHTALSSCEAEYLSSYNDKFGEWELRKEIMQYLNFSRGVVCRPEQILLAAGMGASLSLICQLLRNECDQAAVEEPCYGNTREVLKNHGMKVVPIPLEEDGMDLNILAGSGAKLVFTTPSHQFPMGCIMGINKRLNLIKWAEENHAYIIEDDYDSELRYNSRPIPSMQSMDSNGRIIYFNTFSKAFAPGIRMSFIVLPNALMEKYTQNFSTYNCQVAWTEQKAMQLFMQEGSWNRHMRKICTVNKKKHDTLLSALHHYMKDRVIVYGNNAGLHIVLEVKNGMDEGELIKSAEQVGVRIYPVSVYWENTENYRNPMVLIGYSSLTEQEIEEGICLLQSAWF